MGYSSLCSSIHRNPSYNHTAGRGGERVCKITPHHMAVKWTGERCAQSFDVRGRNASANYCIGYDGEIVGCVDENDRSWCSASGWNDRKAITIEVSNSSTGGDWPISQKSWDSLVRLCADICRRYGFRLSYTGTSSGSLTEHQMYASTNCPGPYLHARMGELARQVNAMLDSGAAPSAPATGGGSKPKWQTAYGDPEWFGPKMAKALVSQVLGGTDDFLSGQSERDKYAFWAVSGGVEYGEGGSDTIRIIQRRLGVPKVDGYYGEATIRAHQKWLKQLGYYTGELDGRHGHETNEAVCKALADGAYKKL